MIYEETIMKKTPLMRGMRRARLALQEFGPYMALAFLPGGSLIALATWLYRRWTLGAVRT